MGQRTCSVIERGVPCPKPHLARSLCAMHYARWRTTGDTGGVGPKLYASPDGRCRLADCDEPHLAKGYCSTHYARWRRNGYVDGAGDRRRRVGVDRCSYEGCSDLVEARGWCGTHYQRWYKHGDPRGGARNADRTDEERFFQNVQMADGPGCWNWMAHTRSGYGRFRYDGQQRQAHRWSYERFVGPIPAGFVVDHSCHNADRSCPGGTCRHRLCIEVSHFEAVTLPENFNRGRRRLRS